jgi:outer membrane protein OmpA-like peptidoglycan-associated protein
MRSRLPAALLAVPLGITLGCATSPPAAPAIAVSVRSSPDKAEVFLKGRRVGNTTVSVGVGSLLELIEITARVPGSELIETRIRIVTPQQAEISFRFGTEPGALAKKLGLTKVLIFDYASNATFDIDRWELKERFVSLLREQATILNGYFPAVEVYVCGHTDDTGTPPHNLELSLKRAQTVFAFLESCGVDKRRMVVQGFGEDYPIEANSTEEGRALNRRTEIILPQ